MPAATGWHYVPTGMSSHIMHKRRKRLRCWVLGNEEGRFFDEPRIRLRPRATAGHVTRIGTDKEMKG